MPKEKHHRRTALRMLAAAAAGAGGGQARRAAAQPTEGKKATGPSQAFSLPRVAAEQAKAGEEWREYLRVESLSVGVYALKKGAVDTQTPHKQDEIYYVSAGRAVLTVEGKDHPVEPGSVVFVAARASHKFHDIREDLTTLVFFAPAYQD
jgi:mannose-6-phosphate isomerase-like protein (cupin superfamily)